MNGNSVNRPQGILTVPTSSATDANRLDVFQSAIYAMRPGYRQGACWFLSPTTLSKIATMKDTLGRFLLQSETAPGMPQTILGYEVVACEHAPEIAANSLSIIIANLGSGYLIVDRISTSLLVDPYSSKPLVGFYARRRVGGAVLNSECIKTIKSAVS